jgi:hypothetical protein
VDRRHRPPAREGDEPWLKPHRHSPPANPFLTESGLAEAITQDAAWAEIIFEQTRKRWMQYATEPPLVWRELADEAIERRVFDAMRPLCPGGFSASKLAGVIKCLKILQGKTLTPTSRDYLPCRNVVLHVPSMTTEAHTPVLSAFAPPWFLPARSVHLPLRKEGVR